MANGKKGTGGRYQVTGKKPRALHFSTFYLLRYTDLIGEWGALRAQGTGGRYQVTGKDQSKVESLKENLE